MSTTVFAIDNFVTFPHKISGLSVGHSATIFRNFVNRQTTIRQKRHSETLPFGKTIRQKIFGNWLIGNNLFGNRTIGNLYSAKVNNEINSVRQNTIRQNTLWKQTFGKFRFRNQSFRKKPFNEGYFPFGLW